MTPTQHPSNNAVLHAPPGWNHDQVRCAALPLTRTAVNGAAAFVSHWRPSSDELEALVAGGTVSLSVFGTSHPPVSLNVAPAHSSPTPKGT